MGDKRQHEPTEYKVMPSIAFKFDEDRGLVEHIITLFGVVDHGKDRSHPGSFKKTLAERGDKVRVLDMHKTDSVMRIVGKPLAIREIERDELPPKVRKDYPEATGGVWAQTQFFMDTPEGKGAFIRVKENTVEWSYGYDALDTDNVTVKLDGEDVDVRDLKQIRLYEYGPVLFGMVPGTTTLSAKTDPGPSESKPAPDETENSIRIRVRNPGDFEDDSIRTINIGPKAQGIQAAVGRLKDGNTMAIQSYIFDKDKWDVDKARAWVDEHKKDGVPELEEKQETEAEAEPEEEQDKTDDTIPEIKEPPEAVVFASVVLQDALSKMESGTWEYQAAELALVKLRAQYGDGVDVAELEAKAGRVLAGRNAQRIGQAIGALISVLEDAGIDIPGVGKKPEPESEDEEEPKDWTLAIETAVAELDLFDLEY